MKTWVQIGQHCRVRQLSEIIIQYKQNNNCIFFSIRAGRYVNRAGRKGVRAGRTVRAGRSTLINMPSWNTALDVIGVRMLSSDHV